MTELKLTSLSKRFAGPFRIALMSAALVCTTGGVLAQDAPQPGPEAVIAVVGGQPITEADLAFAAEDLAQELGNVPPAERRAFLASVVIDMRVMADAARAENMQDSEVFRRRLQYLEDRALRRAFFAEKIAGQVTPEAVRAAYDKMIATFEPQEEIRARHILVTEADDAVTIRAELEGGKPFETAALEHSIDGTSRNGGDLGYFARGQMVPPFEEAAYALEIGQISAPVQSKFGWHIIKLEDRRQSAPPAFEQVAQQLQQQVLVTVFDDSVKALKAKTTIEINDAEIAAAVALSDAEAEK